MLLMVLIFYRFQGWPRPLCVSQLEVCWHWVVAGDYLCCFAYVLIVIIEAKVFSLLRWIMCQVKSGTMFDNVLVSDDPEYAKKLAEETWGKHKDVWLFSPHQICLITDTYKPQYLIWRPIVFAGWEGSIWWGWEEERGGGAFLLNYFVAHFIFSLELGFEHT